MIGTAFHEALRSIAAKMRGRQPATSAPGLAVLDAVASQPADYYRLTYLLAALSSAEYLVSRMGTARKLDDRFALLVFALEQAHLDGLVLEFGVYQGASLRAIARHCRQTVHGFDSFQGLPEDWTATQRKGRFSTAGKLPQFEEPNIDLHPGWFHEVLPGFLESHPGTVRFVHIDCDVYTSTKTVLDLLAGRLRVGSEIVFDEYLNYPGWQQHEHRAFQEFVREQARSYEYLGFASPGHSVVVRLC